MTTGSRSPEQPRIGRRQVLKVVAGKMAELGATAIVAGGAAFLGTKLAQGQSAGSESVISPPKPTEGPPQTLPETPSATPEVIPTPTIPPWLETPRQVEVEKKTEWDEAVKSLELTIQKYFQPSFLQKNPELRETIEKLKQSKGSRGGNKQFLIEEVDEDTKKYKLFLASDYQGDDLPDIEFRSTEGPNGTSTLVINFALNNEGKLIPRGETGLTLDNNRVENAIRRDFKNPPTRWENGQRNIKGSTAEPVRIGLFQGIGPKMEYVITNDGNVQMSVFLNSETRESSEEKQRKIDEERKINPA